MTANTAHQDYPSRHRLKVLRLLRIAYSALDLWAALLLLTITTFHFLSQSLPVSVLIHPSDFLDLSQNLDIIAKSQQGLWLGRDVIFTYGPLFQWLLGRLPMAAGVSLGSYYRTFWIFQFWGIILPAYGFTACVLRRQQPWKRTFCLLMLVVFWSPIFWSLIDVKILLPLCFFAWFVFIFQDPRTGGALAMQAAIVGSAIALSFLLATDAGIYTAGAFALVAASHLLFFFRDRTALRPILRLIVLTLVFLALWALSINIVRGKVGDFHFWVNGYQVVAQYRWSESLAMLPRTAFVFFGTILGCGLIFGYEWLGIRAGKGTPRQQAAWLSMILFSALPLQAAVVTSERFHLALGLLPMIAIAMALWLGALESRPQTSTRETGAVAAVLLLTAVFSGPNHLFRGGNLHTLARANQSSRSCGPNLALLDQACLPRSEFSLLQSVSGYVQANSAASDSVLIFPHQNIFGFLAHRRVAGEVLQSYLVAGDYLTKRQLASFERDRPPLAVYVVVHGGLDGVEYFQRLPQLWLYLQKWYEVRARPQESVFVLRRNPARASSVELHEFPLAAANSPRAVHEGEPIDLGTLSIPAGTEFDFVKIRLKAQYPFSWRLLKPAVTVVKLQFDDGSEVTKLVLAPPNQDYDVWVYPWEPERLVNYFAPDPANWRAGPRRIELEHVAIEFVKADWASVMPSRLTINGVEGVSLTARSLE